MNYYDQLRRHVRPWDTAMLDFIDRAEKEGLDLGELDISFTQSGLCMVAFPFRMGAGFAGDITRHQFQSAAHQNDATSPVLGYGLACMYNGASNDVRSIASGDASATTIAGVIVRAFPLQMPSAPQPFGGTGTVAAPFGSTGTPPAGAAVDVLKQGYILVPCVGTPNLGAAVFVWTGATGGGHTLGGFEAASGTTLAVETDGRTYFNSPPDANGNVELAFNI